VGVLSYIFVAHAVRFGLVGWLVILFGWWGVDGLGCAYTMFMNGWNGLDFTLTVPSQCVLGVGSALG